MLAPVYRDIVGVDLSNHYHPEAKYNYAWVTSSRHGGAVMTLMYGLSDHSFSDLQHHIAHEYFHVLQGQVASGLAPLQDGEIGWHTGSRSVAPQWLVEGFASYADYKYTSTRLGRRPFLGDRYTPFEDLGWSQVNGEFDYGDLARSTAYANALCTFSDFYFYALSFSAAFFLGGQAGDDSYVEFWKLLGARSSWQQAFEEAFGTNITDFYRAFAAWLPSQIPSYDQVTIQMFWPDMETNPQVRGSSSISCLMLHRGKARHPDIPLGRGGFGRMNFTSPSHTLPVLSARPLYLSGGQMIRSRRISSGGTTVEN